MKLRKNEKGQAILEYIILMTVILSVWMGISKVLKSKEFFQTVFGTPWGRLSNTIEFGVPIADRTKAGPMHPSSFSRHSSKLAE